MQAEGRRVAAARLAELLEGLAQLLAVGQGLEALHHAGLRVVLPRHQRHLAVLRVHLRPRSWPRMKGCTQK